MFVITCLLLITTFTMSCKLSLVKKNFQLLKLVFACSCNLSELIEKSCSKSFADIGAVISFKTVRSDFFFGRLSFYKESGKIFLLLFSSLKKVRINFPEFSFKKKIISKTLNKAFMLLQTGCYIIFRKNLF